MKLSQASDSELSSLRSDPVHFDVLFTVTDLDNEELRQSAEIIYRDFQARGLKVVMNDRALANAATLFHPQVEVRLSNAGLGDGCLETRILNTSETRSVPVEDIAETVAGFLGKN